MEQQGKAGTTLNLFVEPTASHIEFADLVQLNANQERVVLAFIQHSAIPISNVQELSGNAQKGPINSRLICQVALTWPHFFRLLDLFRRVLDDNKERLAEIYNLNNLI